MFFFFLKDKRKNEEEVTREKEEGGVAYRHTWKKQRTDEERDWKKVRGKVSRVFHSADSACFQALEIAAVVVAAEVELVIISSCCQGSDRCSPTISCS